MTDYHVHDKGPGRWLERIYGYRRYKVCEGPAHDLDAWLPCDCVGVSATLRGARRKIRRLQRERAKVPYWRAPIVAEEADDVAERDLTGSWPVDTRDDGGMEPPGGG